MEPALRPEDWQRHSAALRGVARRLLGGRDAEVDDLVQGTLLAAVERPPRRLTRGWLTRVLRHGAFDLVRRRRREREVEPPRPEEPPETADVVGRLESYEAVAAAVRALDEPYRRMVWLRWFEDLPPTEIARRAGIPVKTVKTRLRRALALLRGRLEGRYGGDWKAALTPLIGLKALPSPLPAAAWAAGVGLMGKRIAVVVLLVLGAWGALVLGSAMLAPPDVEPGGVAARAGSDVEAGVPGSEGPAPKAAQGSGGDIPPAPDRELARTRAPDGTATGDLRIRVTWHDGTPAANVAVAIGTPWSRNIPTRTLDRVVSNGNGIARATRLPAGEVRLEADRGADAKAEVVAGKVTEVDLRLEAGLRVEGTVVDGKGAPVVGAGVWLTARAPRWLGTRRVGRSGEDGSFVLRGIPGRQSLGATAAGFAPSDLVDLELLDTEQSPVAMRLELVAQGGALAGIVLSPRGEPVPGARVGVVGADRTGSSRVGSTTEERWAPRATTCDGQGRFRFEGMAPGEHPLEVQSAGHPIWHGSVTIAAGETTERTVTLAVPVVLTGIVRDAAGAPVAGASVRAFPRELEHTRYVQGGQFDYDSIFGYPVTASDAEGRYRLDDLAPGEVHAYAMEPRKRSVASYLRDEVVLAPEPGEVLTWDPVLEPGHTIEGVVLYRDGKPMGNLFVTAQDEETGRIEVLHTEKDGRFRFFRLENHPYSVSVQIWDPPEDAPPLGKTGVWPDQGELRLVATWDKPVEPVPGRVSGRVHDAAGRVEGTPGVILQYGERGWRKHPKLENDAFSFDEVRPGRCKVLVMNGEDPVHATDWFEVSPGEKEELGTLVTTMPGSLTLHLVRGEGAEDREPTIYLRRGDSIHATKVQPGGGSVHRVDNLTPGEYEVRVSGRNLVSERVPATVLEGMNAEVEVPLRAAVLRGIEIAYPEQPAVGSFDMTVLDEDGATFYESSRTRKWSAWIDNPWTRRLRFPLGRFTVRLTTDTGWSGEAEFTIDSLDEDQPPVRVELK